MRYVNDLTTDTEPTTEGSDPPDISYTQRYESPVTGEVVEMAASADFDLLLIRMARGHGIEFRDLADGMGASSFSHDWSHIRDSTDAARERMLERALNYFHPDSTETYIGRGAAGESFTGAE